MANPERGGMLETLTPEQRLRELSERMRKRGDEARRVAEVMGATYDVSPEIETLLQFLEKNPSSEGAIEIEAVFSNYEKAAQGYGEKWDAKVRSGEGAPTLMQMEMGATTPSQLDILEKMHEAEKLFNEAGEEFKKVREEIRALAKKFS